MKFSLFFFSIFLLVHLTSAGENAPSNKTNTLLYASFNIRWEGKEDVINGNSWEKRKKPVADLIQENHFDIIGLQEGHSYSLKDLKELLPDYEILTINDNEEYNPLLIKKGMFKVLNHGRFYLSTTPGKKSKSWDSHRTRYCNWFELSYNNSILFIFNTHFDYRGKNARFESTKVVRSLIPQIAEKKPFIIAGDFNSSDNSKVYNELVRDKLFKDARYIADSTKMEKGTFNYFDPTHESKWYFDHIFVSTGIKVYLYRILRTTYHDGEIFRYPSDHFPIMIKFSF